MSPSYLGVFVCAKRAAAADEAGGGSVAAGNPAAVRQLGRVREVQRACAPEIDCTPVVAGNKVQGWCSVAIWLTCSALLMYLASDRLHSSPLVKSLPMRRTLQTFHHCGTRVCYFVFLIRYWGIVTVPGFPRVNRPQIITWGGRILTFHLNYVAGYTGPLLVLFERTHNYYADNQGRVPWWLRRLGRSQVRLASLVK